MVPILLYTALSPICQLCSPSAWDKEIRVRCADKAARGTAFSDPQGSRGMGTELWGEMEGGPPQWQHRSRRSRNPPRPCNEGAWEHM